MHEWFVAMPHPHAVASNDTIDYINLDNSGLCAYLAQT
jgi:hypothetical protein